MKKKITYYTRYINNFRCVETQQEAMILNIPPLKQGDLYYFKLTEFEYLVLYQENGIVKKGGFRKMNKTEIDKRLLSYNESKIKDNLHCSSIITIFYASYKDVFVFNADGLSDDEKIGLVNSLITEIQSGTAYTREIQKRYGNVFFVY